MPCPCSTSSAGAAPVSDPERSLPVNRERVIVLLIGIALGLYVVPRVRAKLGV